MAWVVGAPGDTMIFSPPGRSISARPISNVPSWRFSSTGHIGSRLLKYCSRASNAAGGAKCSSRAIFPCICLLLVKWTAEPAILSWLVRRLHAGPLRDLAPALPVCGDGPRQFLRAQPDERDADGVQLGAHFGVVAYTLHAAPITAT